LEFSIPGLPNSFIDLADSYLYLKVSRFGSLFSFPKG
jgi:hypothetical protein